MRSRMLALRAAGVAGTTAIWAAVPILSATAATAATTDDGVTATAGSVAVASQGKAQVAVEGCKDGRATVSSGAFARVATLAASRTKGGALYGDVSVKSLTTAGRDDISVACDVRDQGSAGTLRVVDGGQHGHATPNAPVQAGGGGTADRPVGAGPIPQTTVSGAQSGPGTPYTLAGLGLAAVAAVAVAYRSSRRRRTAFAPADRNTD